MSLTLSELSNKIAPFWEGENSLPSLYQRMKQCQEQIEKDLCELTAKVSSAFHDHTQQAPLFSEWGKKLLEQSAKIQKIEEALAPAEQLETDTAGLYIRNLDKWSAGDYESFSKRLDALRKQLQIVYRNALYPSLLSLQNAEKGWDPAGYISMSLVYFYQWRAQDARQLFLQESKAIQADQNSASFVQDDSDPKGNKPKECRSGSKKDHTECKS